MGATAAHAGAHGNVPTSADAPVVLVDQGHHRIVVLPDEQRAWDHDAAEWEWRPAAVRKPAGWKLAGREATDWARPTDAKLRHRGGRRYLLTTDSLGLAAVVRYPEGGAPVWAADVGSAANPHSIDLLPDGDVAVVASDGDWLRVYPALARPRSKSYAQYDLPRAHGVFWDRHTRLLWALGEDRLVGLAVGGDAAHPRLRHVRSVRLPSGGGHDLEPVAGHPDLFWVATRAHVYQYSVSLNRFTTGYAGSSDVDAPDVKAVGDLPDGRILTARVERGNACAWCTNTATLTRPAGRLTYPGGQLYKIRWWYDPTV